MRVREGKGGKEREREGEKKRREERGEEEKGWEERRKGGREGDGTMENEGEG